jgi:hypothetical protein
VGSPASLRPHNNFTDEVVCPDTELAIRHEAFGAFAWTTVHEGASSATYVVVSRALVAVVVPAEDRVSSSSACSKRIDRYASQLRGHPSCATDTVCAGEGNGRSAARSRTVVVAGF